MNENTNIPTTQEPETAVQAPETAAPETENTTATAQEPDELTPWEEERILPEGWTEGTDLFADDTAAPEGETAAPDAETTQEGDAAPATETEAAENGEATPTTETADTTAPATDAPTEEPDYKAMYEALVQKDREAQDRATFRKVYQEEVDAGMSERWAMTAAANAVGGKTFPLTDDAPAASAAPEPDAAMQAARQLSTLFPGLKEIPPEVSEKVRQGADLVSAYSAYRSQQDAATIAALRQENARLRRQAENVVKAPPQGVTGGAVKPEADDFIKGFERAFR